MAMVTTIAEEPGTLRTASGPAGSSVCRGDPGTRQSRAARIEGPRGGGDVERRGRAEGVDEEPGQGAGPTSTP